MLFYYYVVPVADDQWELRSSLEAKPTTYSSHEAAVREAKKHCRRHWEQTGNPCGVRVRTADGTWEDHHLMGEGDKA